MSDMWREAEAYANYCGEGRLDRPPEPERDDIDEDYYRLALRDAIQAIEHDREEHQPLHYWAGMKRATAVLRRMLHEDAP